MVARAIVKQLSVERNGLEALISLLLYAAEEAMALTCRDSESEASRYTPSVFPKGETGIAVLSMLKDEYRG